MFGPRTKRRGRECVPSFFSFPSSRGESNEAVMKALNHPPMAGSPREAKGGKGKKKEAKGRLFLPLNRS